MYRIAYLDHLPQEFLTDELVKLMKPGSIVYDLAAEQGGNSAFSEKRKN